MFTAAGSVTLRLFSLCSQCVLGDGILFFTRSAAANHTSHRCKQKFATDY